MREREQRPGKPLEPAQESPRLQPWGARQAVDNRSGFKGRLLSTGLTAAKKFFKKVRSDRAESLVTAVIVFPVIAMFIITGVDYSVYMADRGQVQAVARDAARTGAIYGGSGTRDKATPIEKAYGQTISQTCGKLKNDSVASEAINGNSTPLECNIANTLDNQSGLVGVSVTGISCSPKVTTHIGQNVTCSVNWKYSGIPGSALSAFGTTGKNGDGSRTTRGTSQSEVVFTTNDLVGR